MAKNPFAGLRTLKEGSSGGEESVSAPQNTAQEESNPAPAVETATPVPEDTTGASRKVKKTPARAPRDKPAPAREPVAPPSEGERMLSARVPHSVFEAFDERVREGRQYFHPAPSKEESLTALVGLLEDKDTFERWLDAIEAARLARAGGRKR